MQNTDAKVGNISDHCNTNSYLLKSSEILHAYLSWQPNKYFIDYIIVWCALLNRLLSLKWHEKRWQEQNNGDISATKVKNYLRIILCLLRIFNITRLGGLAAAIIHVANHPPCRLWAASTNLCPFKCPRHGAPRQFGQNLETNRDLTSKRYPANLLFPYSYNYTDWCLTNLHVFYSSGRLCSSLWILKCF